MDSYNNLTLKIVFKLIEQFWRKLYVFALLTDPRNTTLTANGQKKKMGSKEL